MIPRWLETPLRSSTGHLCQVFDRPPGLGFSPPAIVASITRLGNRPLFWTGHGLHKEVPPFTDGRFDALASYVLAGLRVREGGVIGTSSTLETNGSQEDLSLIHI